MGKVIGFKTTRDPSAPHGEQIVHLAELECGHLLRVGHGHVPRWLRCLEGCDPPPPPPLVLPPIMIPGVVARSKISEIEEHTSHGKPWVTEECNAGKHGACQYPNDICQCMCHELTEPA